MTASARSGSRDGGGGSAPGDAPAPGRPAAADGADDATATGGCSSAERGRRDRGAARDQRGAGSMLTAMTIALTMVAFLVVLVVGSYLVADHRAGAAADQAALSGASGVHDEGVDPAAVCGTARRVAALNGAKLVTCGVEGDLTDYVVHVRVAVEVGVLWPGLPSQLHADAWAGRVSG